MNRVHYQGPGSSAWTQFHHIRLFVILTAIRRVESEHCVLRSIFASTHCADALLSSTESCRLFCLSVPWLWSNRPERCARTCREESSLTTFNRLTWLICTFPLCFYFLSLIPHCLHLAVEGRFTTLLSGRYTQMLFISLAFTVLLHHSSTWFKLQFQVALRLWWYNVSFWHVEWEDAALVQLSAFFMSLKLSSMWGQILCWKLGTTAGLCIYE